MTEPDGAAVTFLFTDLEDSTRLWDEHPEAMPAALARHDEILRGAINRHGGEIVKTTGDGLLAITRTAEAAVAAAADAQRALVAEASSSPMPLKVRMGVHTGVAEHRDGDYFGSEVNRGARLMAVAHGGQVVMSQVTAEHVKSALGSELKLVDLGEHRLRGLSRPERVFQLTIAGLPAEFPPLQSLDAFPSSMPLPGPAFARLDEELAGRDRELERLGDVWRQAVEGTGQIVLLAGEPGIGKTRLAAEMARRAHAEGAVVLYGRSDQEAIVPYQPFVEALRPLVAVTTPATMRERLHGLEADLARIFPELVGRMPSAASSFQADPETERYRLFEAITTLLTGATVAQPAVLVLDDMHWADGPTVLLLKHLVRAAQHHALLVIGCYRDVELSRGHPLSDLLADLRREPCATWIALHGLTPVESAALLRAVAAHELAPSLLETLHRESGGNPFFLEELLRHLVETGVLAHGDGAAIDVTTLDLPAGIRDVVVRRLARLPEEVNETLSLAAVLGPSFDAVDLARAAERSAEQILEQVDTAASAGLLVLDPAVPGAYAFGHALIRQTLYAELGPARRAQMHARAAHALEKSVGAVGAATLAHHFSNALPLVDIGKAVGYLTTAGHDAVSDLAFEESVSFFERALDLLARSAPSNVVQRIALLIDRADALVYVDERAGVEAAFGAVREARSAGSAEQFARAVVVFAEPSYGTFAYPTDVEELIREAVANLGEEHPQLRARLLAIHAFQFASYQLPGRGARALAQSSLELARVAADPPTLALALLTQATSMEGSPDVGARLALGEELVALGHRFGPGPWTFGLRVMARGHLERGDAQALTAAVDELRLVGTEMQWLPARLFHAQWGATRALMEGRFDEVGEFANAMRDHSRAYQAATGMLAVQRFYLARERGEVPIQMAAHIADMHVETIYPRAMYASAQLLAGDVEGASQMLDRIAANGFHRDAEESGWPAGLALLSEIAVAVNSPHCGTLRELFAPFEGHLIVALAALACLGAADRYLGMLSTAIGDHDAAMQHFDRAIAAEERIGGRALVPRTNLWRARGLLARAGPQDAADARGLLTRVAIDASELGMRGIAADAELLAAG